MFLVNYTPRFTEAKQLNNLKIMKVSILTTDGTAVVLKGESLIKILEHFFAYGFEENQILSITILKTL